MILVGDGSGRQTGGACRNNGRNFRSDVRSEISKKLPSEDLTSNLTASGIAELRLGLTSRLIQAAEISKKIPTDISSIDATNLSATRMTELVGKSFARSQALVQAAEISRRLPAGFSLDVKTELGASHLSEIGRLAPNKQKSSGAGREKDYSRLRKQDVARVLKKAVEIADES